MSYRIEETEHGLLVFGSMPIDEMAALSKLWTKRGYKFMAPGIASALGAMMAVTGNVKAWQKVVEAEVSAKNPEDPELQWLRGTDTGSSSKTIFSVLCRPDLRHAAVAGNFRPDIPYDPDDFGRCYRVVTKFKWSGRLSEVANAHLGWAPFVEHWEELASLFHRSELDRSMSAAEQKTHSTALYDLLKKCRGSKP